ncbi:hypothetical protein, partial [Actinoalloteichus spitiensis]|uniref:hypothetical protein n=1 Tax=Actinoalloteichus spitiensis TaxID=252394 RepID=UPI001B7F83B8
ARWPRVPGAAPAAVHAAVGRAASRSSARRFLANARPGFASPSCRSSLQRGARAGRAPVRAGWWR